MQLILELPTREEQIAFNRKRWAELLADPIISRQPYRIETNAHGQILMMPPAAGGHSYRQRNIQRLLEEQIGGIALPECPVSTINGVRSADVGWYSEDRFSKVKGQIAFEIAPEICVEVLSPDNTTGEMEEKKTLYFEAGAEEFWICDLEGKMSFFGKDLPKKQLTQSSLAPDFPGQVEA